MSCREQYTDNSQISPESGKKNYLTPAAMPESPHSLVHPLRNSSFGLQLLAVQFGSWPSLSASAQHDVCFLFRKLLPHHERQKNQPTLFAFSEIFPWFGSFSPGLNKRLASRIHGTDFLSLWASRFHSSSFFVSRCFYLIGKSNHYNDILRLTRALLN